MKDIEQLIPIITKLQNGNEEAAADLYNAFHDDVYYFILKTVNDPELAADLMQDTFIEILQTIGNLKEPAAFPAWSRQIAYHKCTAHFRKRHDLLVDENDDGQTVFDTLVEEREEFIPGEALEKQDLRQIIHRIINELPEDQRAAIMMRYFDELSVKEIAKIQCVSEGTVKSRLNYGRQGIKQAVKEYEKKNDVKLHCAGIIPLLLWLFKISGGFRTTTLAGKGLEVAGKLTAKKVIAGVLATAAVAGGVTAGILLTNTPPPEEPEPPMQWYGYGQDAGLSQRRFDISLDKMQDDYIEGYLEVSVVYDVIHATKFSGEGVRSDGNIVYTINFETPAVLGTIITFEYSQIEMTYNKTTDEFTFDDFYEVCMHRIETKPTALLAKNQTWTGYGEDDFYNDAWNATHSFTLEVYEQRETEINGKLIVSYNGKIDHETEFVGRGYMANNEIHYEIKLDTPRTVVFILEYTLDGFWLTYDIETDTFKTSALATYSFELEKIH